MAIPAVQKRFQPFVGRWRCPVDGQAEFRRFVQQTEKELRILFDSIDRDKNGRLDKGELRFAFAQAGLTVPRSELDRFFDEIDANHDGSISFDEWW